MTDVFISYAREDRDRIKVIAEELIARQLEVWWDPKIRYGQEYRIEIAEALDKAHAVIVAWSKHSVASSFVRDEADEALRRNKLMPVLLDLVDVPLGHRQNQFANLSDWNGDKDDPAFRAFIDAMCDYVAEKKGLAPAQAVKRSAFWTTGAGMRLRLVWKAILLGIIVGLASLPLFLFLALISEPLRMLALQDSKPLSLAELIANAQFWQECYWLMGGLALFAFVARLATLWTDGILGAASLTLISRSVIVMVLAGLIATAPIELNDRYSSGLEPLYSAAISPDGNTLAATSPLNWLMWKGPREPVFAPGPGANIAAVSADLGRYLEVSQRTGTLCIGGSSAFERCLPSVEQYKDARLSADGTHVAIEASDDTISVWSSVGATRQVTPRPVQEIKSFYFSPDDRYLGVKSGQGVLLFDLVHGRRWTASQAEEPGGAFSFDGKRYFVVDSPQTLRIWDLAGAAVAKTVPLTRDKDEAARDFELSPDGRWIAIWIETTKNSRISSHWRIFDTATGLPAVDLPSQPTGDHFSPKGRRAFSFDGMQFASLPALSSSEQQDNNLGPAVARAWDTRTARYFDLVGHLGTIKSIGFSHDGAYIVTASTDKTARLWDAHTGRTVAVLSGHLGAVNAAVFAPDDKTVATVSDDGTARLWDVRSGEQKGLLKAYSPYQPPLGGYLAMPPVPGLAVRNIASGDAGVEAWITPALAMHCFGFLAMIVLIAYGARWIFGSVVKPQLVSSIPLAVYAVTVACLAVVYLANLAAEGLLFWLLYAILATPLLAIGRLLIVLTILPAASRRR